jgi:hypothetical protein
MFSGFPFKALRTELCKALPKEKVRVQGFAKFFIAFIALRILETSSSD